MRDQTMKIPQAEERIRDQECPESLGKTRNVWPELVWPHQFSANLSLDLKHLSLHFNSLQSQVRARYFETDLDKFYF